MNKTIIQLDDVSMSFPIYDSPKDMMTELLFKKKRHNKFWALKDISFSIKEKSRVGIIGPNGSGKSTLLKLITGNLTASKGKVQVDGKITGMLSLNTVLNPDETGLNNIRFNLILNGCEKSKIDELANEIVEFTELGQFIYSPVRTYSTGMNARLAFAIATSIEPEILVVDEVLSVGDAYFVGKATKRMIDLCENGKALVFVSHSITDVQRLCDTVIWLENGIIRNMGPTDYIVKLYEEDYRRREDDATREMNKERNKELNAGGIDDAFDNTSIAKLRLVTKSGHAFQDSYFIKSLKYKVSKESSEYLPISIINDTETETETIEGSIDKFSSEWGRVYEWKGTTCRMLEANSGRYRGGHFSLPIKEIANDRTEYYIEIEYRKRANGEPLTIEYFDYTTAGWTSGTINDQQIDPNKWETLVVEIEYPIANKKQIELAKKIFQEREKPPVEILDVGLYSSDDTPMLIVQEREPFEVRVKIQPNVSSPKFDVSIKIMRSDGVYAFWQSSGQVEQNITNLDGVATVTFDFSENVLGAGEYTISAATTNGWDFPDNYPYSEVFDRKVSCLTFDIRREVPELDFGVVNMRVPAKVVYEDQ